MPSTIHTIAEGAARFNTSIKSGPVSILDYWLLQEGKMLSGTKISQQFKGVDCANPKYEEDETMKLPIGFQEPVGPEGWSDASTTLDSLPDYSSSSMDSLPSPRQFMSKHFQPDTSETTSSLDKKSSIRSALSIRPKIHDLNVTFSDCIEVHEFSPEPCVSSEIFIGSVGSPFDTADEEEQEQEQDIMQNISPQLGKFGKGVERRSFRKSVTANFGFRPSNVGSLTVEKSGLWRRRRLSNDSTRV